MTRILVVCFVIAITAGCGSKPQSTRFISPSEIAAFRAAGLHPLVALDDTERPVGLIRAYGFNNAHDNVIAELLFFGDTAQATSLMKSGRFVGSEFQNDSAVLVLLPNSALQPELDATKQTRATLLRVFRRLRPRG